MKIGILGAGNIGGNLARLLASAGHDVVISFSRDGAALDRLAKEIGVRAGSPADAASHGDLVVLSVPWPVIDDVLEQAGGPPALAGKIVIDTTNNFSWDPDGGLTVVDLGATSAARHNAAKAPGARWVKAFNTLTAGFQATAVGRSGPERVVMFYATDIDDDALIVEQIIVDAGFDPIRTGTLDRN